MAAETDIRAHKLVHGCMGLGGGWDTEPYTAEDVQHAETAIEAALAAGITAFDHPDIYRYGKSEAVFGEVLARSHGLRERIVLQTKCGIRLPDGGRPGHYDLRGASILRRVEESLVRLRTDVLDVLLLHRPDPLADPVEIAEALTALHAQGLVRQFGVSNMSGSQIAALQAHVDVPLVVNQLEMSLAQRDRLEAGVLFNTPDATRNGFTTGTLECCAANGVRLQAWGSAPPAPSASAPAGTRSPASRTSRTRSGTSCGSPHAAPHCPERSRRTPACPGPPVVRPRPRSRGPHGAPPR
ncbi:aldo/keto reductase [Streptomyces sp. NPDC006184]|uniref:aldo/keto reductase n=1 Tax=Streptomyces sp. NPDC006184 TaxID=3155455 RepID=UPI0033A038F9